MQYFDPQNQASNSSITVGVSVAVMLVLSMGGFILGMIAGTCRTMSLPHNRVQFPWTSHSQDRTSPKRERERGGGDSVQGDCPR